MDQKDVERLQRNWINLLESVNSDEVIPYLMQDLIFDANILEEISAENTRKNKTQLMLRILIKRGPKAYGSFRRALHANEVYHHLVDKLDRTEFEDNPLVAQPSEDMPGIGGPMSPIGTLRTDGGPTPSTPPTPEDMPDIGGPMSPPGTLRTDGGPTPLTPPTPSTSTNPLPVVRTEFTDLECWDLAELLDPDSDFPKLGLQLRFKNPAMSRYRRENSGGSSHGTYKMLVDWKKQFLDHEQRENLSNALDNAGLRCLAFQVRHGQKLELVASPPPCVPPVSHSAGNLKTSTSTPSLQTHTICPPKSLRSFPPTSRVELEPRPGSDMPLPIHTDPSPGEDVRDKDFFNMSQHLNLCSFRMLGLSLGYTLEQLDAFETKSCNDVPNAGLEMLKDLKRRVGHIRKAEFKTFLQTEAKLPSLVEFS